MPECEFSCCARPTHFSIDGGPLSDAEHARYIVSSKPPGLAASSINDKSFAMRSCGIAIIGLGLMGSSALYSLARRGADVLGFVPLVVGDAREIGRASCRERV